MRKMSINVVVLKTDIQRNIDYNQNIVKNYPEAVYNDDIDKQKYSSTIYKYRLKGVSTCSISDNSEDLTQTAIIEIPIKNTILKRDGQYRGKYTKGYLLFKNGVKLFEGNQVMIDIGYDDNLQTRFIGYITKFIENDPYITIELEDSMYKLKNTISIKKNFPKNIDLDNGTDAKEPFNLIHLNKWIVKKLYDWNKGINTDVKHPLTFVPKIRCYNTDLGKIIMRNNITPAEIFKYYFKDVYKMKIFFRNEYIASNRDKEEFNYLMEPVLYVGWSNWNLLPYNEIEIINGKAETSKEKKFYSTDLNDEHRTYSETFKFMYPYNIIDSNNNIIRDYNPIITNNLEWYNTHKDNIKITASSFNSVSNTKTTVEYQYGEYKTVNGKIETPIKSPEEIGKFNKKELDKYKKELAKQKVLEEQRKIEESQSSIIGDSNNLQVFNEVTLNYPNLNEGELISNINDYFTAVPDSGLQGSFTILGDPYVRQGDIVQLVINSSHIDGALNLVSDVDSNNLQTGYVQYYVKSVNTTFDNSNGIRQEITIDKKVI